MPDASTTSDRTDVPATDWIGLGIRTGALVGVATAVVGLIDGIVLMAKRKVTECENGHYFPEGTKDFNCYAHPHGLEGLAISAISVSVGVLVLLVAYVALATFKDRASSPAV